MSAPIEVTLTYTEEEARETARAILYFTSNVSATHEDHDRMVRIRSAIKGALPQPKPAEPQGFGAVVEDDRGIRFVRTYSVEHATPWITGNHRRAWCEVAAVRVLSEGLTP